MSKKKLSKVVTSRWLERLLFLASSCLVFGVLGIYFTAEEGAGSLIITNKQIYGLLAGALGCLVLAWAANRFESLRLCQVFSIAAVALVLFQMAIIVVIKGSKGSKGWVQVGSTFFGMVSFLAGGLQAISLFFLVLYGELTYDRAQKKLLGPKGVGSQQFWTSKHGNFVVASYPISKKHFDSTPKNKWMPFNLFGKKLEKAMGKLAHSNLTGERITKPDQEFPQVKMVNHLFAPSVRDAEFDLAKPGQEMKLIPVIYSHAYSCCIQMHYLHQIELAANGYIVFAINHNDETCLFTIDQDKKDIQLDLREPLISFDRRKEQLKIRKAEVAGLIDEICEPGYLQKQLGFPVGVTLATDKLITMGVSFGGITSVATGVSDPRVRASCSFDAWMFPVHQDGPEFKVPSETAFFTVRSETFNDWCIFPAAKANEEFLNRHIGTHPNFNSVVFGNASHCDSTDFACLMPLELYLSKYTPGGDISKLEFGGKAETVLSHLWLVMDFLISQGLSSSMTNTEAIQQKVKNLYKSRVHKEVWEGEWKWTGQRTEQQGTKKADAFHSHQS